MKFAETVGMMNEGSEYIWLESRKENARQIINDDKCCRSLCYLFYA
jgi:hypothetical protein